MLAPVSVGLKFGFLIILYLFLHTIGYNFFVSGLAGNYTGPGSGAIGVASYVYFSALAASSRPLPLSRVKCNPSPRATTGRATPSAAYRGSARL